MFGLQPPSFKYQKPNLGTLHFPVSEIRVSSARALLMCYLTTLIYIDYAVLTIV
jgi:hypothetical protein